MLLAASMLVYRTGRDSRVKCDAHQHRPRRRPPGGSPRPVRLRTKKAFVDKALETFIRCEREALAMFGKLTGVGDLEASREGRI